MGEEQESSQVEVDTPERSTIPGIGEQKYPDTKESNMNADVALYIPSQLIHLADVIDDVRSVLVELISTIKSGNQSNGRKVSTGWMKSMTREPWEHLQYAADLLASPKADIYDLLESIQCLMHSDPTYEVGQISWDKIHEKYPAPPVRAIKPILMPGPPDGWEDIDYEWEDEIWRELIAYKTDPTIPESGPTTEPELIPAAIEPTAAQDPSIPAEAPVTPAPAPEQAAKPVQRVRRLQFYDDLAKERAKEEAA
jgi:hypothetical protein